MVVRMVEWKVVKLVKSLDGKTVGMKVVTLVLRLERLMVVMMAVMSEKMKELTWDKWKEIRLAFQMVGCLDN